MSDFIAVSHNLKPLTSNSRMDVEVDTVRLYESIVEEKAIFFQQDKTIYINSERL